MRMNKKISLPMPLLLLLFVFPYRSESASASPSADYITQLFQKIRPWEKNLKRTKDTLEAVQDHLKKKGYLPLRPPPPPPFNPPTTPHCTRTVPRIHLLKEYLSAYGYMDDSANFTDCVDSELVSAIKSYQRFFNLPITGTLGRDTVQQLSLSRCAVPDKNLSSSSSSSSNGDVSWPNGTEWLAGRRSLTYGFHPNNTIPPNTNQVFTDSFLRWSRAVRVMNLTQSDSFERADIKIGFYAFDETVGGEVVGGSIVKYMGGGFFGEMVLGEGLLEEEEEGGVDLGSVVMHQIGHLLGLSHSSEVGSVMYPYVAVNGTTVRLSGGDLEEIKRLYSSSDGKSVGGVASNNEGRFSGGGDVGGGGIVVIGSGWGLLAASSLSVMLLF